MAWAEDTVGRRQYVVKVMELATHKVLPIALPNVENNIIWAGDNQTFFYIEKDPETLLGFRVRSHRLDSANHTDVAADPLVWDAGRRELLHAARRAPRTRNTCSSTRRARCPPRSGTPTPPPRNSSSRCSCRASATMSTRWSTPTTAGSCAPTGRRRTSASSRCRAAPKATARNGRTSSRIATMPSSTHSTCRATSSPSRSIRAACASCAFGRGHGTAAQDVFVTADEPSYTMALDVNREFDSDKLRYTYHVHGDADAPRTTTTSRRGERELLKREPVLGGYDPANYATEFAWATARDGTKVPVSHRVPQDHAARRHRAAAADRLWLVRLDLRSRSSPTCLRRCWIAASSSPSRTSAAARKWAAPGTRTASC